LTRLNLESLASEVERRARELPGQLLLEPRCDAALTDSHPGLIISFKLPGKWHRRCSLKVDQAVAQRIVVALREEVHDGWLEFLS
jgi:hypothetical protein